MESEPATLFVVGSYRTGKVRAYVGPAPTPALGWRIFCQPAKLRVSCSVLLAFSASFQASADFARLGRGKRPPTHPVTLIPTLSSPCRRSRRLMDRFAQCMDLSTDRSGWTASSTAATSRSPPGSCRRRRTCS